MGGAKVPPISRAIRSHRRSVAPLFRRTDVPTCRSSDAPHSQELKPKTSELQSKSYGLNPKPQNLKAKTSLLKPKTAELKKIQPETPGPKPRPQS